MKRIGKFYKITVFFWGFLFFSCSNQPVDNPDQPPLTQIRFDAEFACDCSIRAIDARDTEVFFAGSNSTYGYLNTDDLSVRYLDSIATDEEIGFRGLARTSQKDLILGVDNPAYIYEVDAMGKQDLLFEQDIEGTFFDSMRFWNDEEGIIMGDPIEECLAFYITRDGGHHWEPVSCEKLGSAEDGEAAFAASNSNIAIKGDSTWVISGGQISKVYFSPDKGENWEVFNTPLINGKPTTGGYAIDFYDAQIGIAVGGDYTEPSNDKANKIFTNDGGKTWKMIADGNPPGYRSDVKFVPGKKGKELMAVGTGGISYSADYGQNWNELSDRGFHAIAFLNDTIAFVSGDEGITKLRIK